MPKTSKPRSGSARTLAEKARVATDSSGRMANATKEKQRTIVGDKGLAKMGNKGYASTEQMTPSKIASKREAKKVSNDVRIIKESYKYMKNKNVPKKKRDTFKATFLGS